MFSHLMRRLGYVPAGQLDQVQQQLSTLSKRLEEFAALAVPPRPGGRQTPAGWTVDRNEYVQHYTNSTYIAVGAISRKVAMQEALVKVRTVKKSGEKLEPVEEDHPLVQLFRRVNPLHVQFDLFFYMAAWRLITGASYFWKARNGLGVPAELWPLPSQWVHAVPSELAFIDRYRVQGVFGREVTLPREDVLTVAEPNLDWSGTGRYYGRPVMQAGATMVDVEEALQTRLFNTMRNLAPPGMVFEYVGGGDGRNDYSLDDLTAMYQFLATQHGLTEQTGRPMVAPPGFKLVQDNSQRPREMDYTRSLEATLDYTLAIYGVPKAVVGLSRDYNRANFLAAMASFCMNVVNPLLVHSGQHLTQDLAAEFDDRLVVQFDPCTPDDAEELRKSYEVAIKGGAVTPNEIREAMLGLGPYESGGNRPLVQGGIGEAPMGNVSQADLDAEQQQQEQRAQQAAAQAAAAAATAEGEDDLDDEIDKAVDGWAGLEVPDRLPFRLVRDAGQPGRNGHAAGGPLADHS